MKQFSKLLLDAIYSRGCWTWVEADSIIRCFMCSQSLAYDPNSPNGDGLVCCPDCSFYVDKLEDPN